MFNKNNLQHILHDLQPYQATLVAVSKTKPAALIKEAYDFGYKIFGENYAQELAEKYTQLPKDIEWHFIGHLQSNKVKLIAPFVHLIHGVDSFDLLKEINKQGKKNNRVVNCLLQIYIAQEETKFGLSFEEGKQILSSPEIKSLENVSIIGLMGMTSLTDNKNQIQKEFRSLNLFFCELKSLYSKFKILSMGMTSDYKIALAEGSTMVRIGSAIFGERN